jgi:hypothetical protein
MLASQVPQPDHVDSALNTILAQGVLGAIAVLLAVAFFVAIRGWLHEKDGRRTDQKEMAKALEGINVALRDLVIECNKHASNLAIEAARSQDAMKGALQNQERALSDVRETVSKLQTEQVRLGMLLQNGNGKK